MRIILINPPINPIKRYGRYSSSSGSSPPLGLCYLASILLKQGHFVRIIDGMHLNLSTEEILTEVIDFYPEIVGIHVSTITFPITIKICKHLRKEFPGIKIILGGPHFTFENLKTDLSVFKSFNVAVIGEAEETIKEICQCYESEKTSLDKIKGIVYLNNSKLVITQRRPLITNLNKIPFPARHLISISGYASTSFYSKNKRSTSLISSRGCLSDCIFCSTPSFGKNWRAHSFKYVINEIEHVISKYGIKEISFCDDNFCIDMNRIKKICDSIKKMRVVWSANSRIDNIDENLMRIMHDSGCWQINFGIETGDKLIQKNIKKNIDLKYARHIIQIADSIGIKAKGLFMLGLPYESKKTVEKTICFASSLRLSYANFYLAYPIPGSVLFKDAEKYGIFKNCDYINNSGHPTYPIFAPYGISRKYLLKKQKEAYIKFYFGQKRLANVLKDVMRLNNLKDYAKGMKTLFRLIVAH